MEGDLTASYERVHREYSRYRKRLTFTFILLYTSMTMLALVLILFPAASRNNSFSYSIFAVVGFSMLTASLALTYRANGPSMEKRLFMRTYRVLSSLTNYLMDSSKIEERRRAEKRLRLLIQRVERLWSLDSRLEEKVLAPIPTFKTNLRDRVLYAMEEGSIENLRNAYNFLARFARFLLREQPQISEVEEMNQIVAPLPERPVNKGNLIIRFLDWLGNPARGRVLFPLGLALASGPVFFLASTLGGMPPQVAFGPSTTVSMGFTTGYLTYYLTRTRPTKEKKETGETQREEVEPGK